MRQERYVNNAQTTLNGGINASTTTVVVTDGSVFPTEGDFRIIIDSELMLVMARATNSLTVIRGQEGTTGATHSDTADVRATLTAGALTQYRADFEPHYIPGSTLPKRLFNPSGVPIGQSSFTWYNQSTSTSEDLDDGSILLTTPANASNNWRGKYVTPPATPWIITAAFSMFWMHEGGGEFPTCGLTVQNSSDSKLITMGLTYRIGFTPRLSIGFWTNTFTGVGSYVVSTSIGTSSDLIWLRYTDDGVDHKQYISVDGINWLFLHSVSRTDWLSNGGDRVGFGHDAWNNNLNAWPHFTYIKHWSWS